MEEEDFSSSEEVFLPFLRLLRGFGGGGVGSLNLGRDLVGIPAGGV